MGKEPCSLIIKECNSGGDLAIRRTLVDLVAKLVPYFAIVPVVLLYKVKIGSILDQTKTIDISGFRVEREVFGEAVKNPMLLSDRSRINNDTVPKNVTPTSKEIDISFQLI